ncbi:MAG: molybdopterin-dependent oxidoreductase [Deltaproteobacteria bacterium]|nr:molybdopterin-dependent oxidoreductase [Deltaproteobacteria bacterium]
MKITRRSFLRNVGAGAAGAWLSPLQPWKAFAQEPIRKPFDPLLKNHFLSVCRQCPQGCGVLAEVLGGKIKKLRGNPLHPTNRGTLCARGISALQLYYSPDRIWGPLRRKGARGSGQWEPVSWDEALKTVADKLVRLRNARTSDGLVMVVDQFNGLEGLLARRFCQAFGTSNYVDLSQYPASGALNASAVMQGMDVAPIFDIKNASYLLSLNVPFLETSRSPIGTWKAFADFRTGKGHPRGRFVHFSPTRDLTASKADDWIPIKPGTEGAVALGIAHVMLQEGLYKNDFVAFNCQGFERRQDGQEELPGFHEHILQNYKPAQVSEISGAPVEKIVGVARAFALSRAPLALWQDQVGVSSQPLQTQMAIHSLNALVGNIDASGGVLAARTLPDRLSPEVVVDALAREGLGRGPLVSLNTTQFRDGHPASSALPERILAGSPHAVQALFLYRANPVFDQVSGEKYREVLRTIGFSVCVAAHHNDTTVLCDLVLPESHALESWHAGVNFTQDGFPFFNLAEPVLPRRYDTRHVGEVFLDLGRRCGGSVAQSLPWRRFQDVAFGYIGQIEALKAGDTFGPSYQESLTRQLERIGWRTRLDDTSAGFWREALKTGGWWDPIYYQREWGRSLRTDSGRFEFFPNTLWARLRRSQAGRAITKEEKSRILPHYVPPEAKGKNGEYPLALLVYALPHLAQVESPNQPWLQEICGSERQYWSTWLDINPEEAKHHRLVERDEVWLESEKGKVRLRCRFDHGIQPGTVRVASGLGHADGGRWMKGFGVAPAAVVTGTYDALAGMTNWQTTRVRIRKA